MKIFVGIPHISWQEILIFLDIRLNGSYISQNGVNKFLLIFYTLFANFGAIA